MLRLVGQVDPGAVDLSSLGELGRLTLGDWLWAGGFVAASVVVAMVVRRTLLRALETSIATFAARLIARVAAAAIVLVGFIYGMQRVGVSAAPVLGILGLAGLAVAFAFQEVLENFIAGVFMSVRRPFGDGDEVTVGEGHEGVVLDIQMRSVVLRTYDGEQVFVPNSMVWQNPIVNHTDRASRRTTIVVGVAYDTDLDRATSALADAVAAVDGVLAEPPAETRVIEFGDSSINIAVRFWHRPGISELWSTRDLVAKAVKRRCDEDGIGIPFPQRVITMAERSA